MYLGRVVEAGPTEEVLDRAAAPLHAGPAVRRTRDGAARADRAARARSRPDADPVGLPLPPALPGARLGRGGRRSPTPAAVRRCRSCPRDPEGHRCACHLVAPGSRPARPTGGARMTLQAALPRELYVDPAAWRARARAGAAPRVDLRRPGRRPRAARAGAGRRRRGAGRVPGGDVGRRRRPARGVQRVPAPRLPAVPDRAGHRAAAVRRRSRSAAPTTRGPTPSTARCCARRTPRTGEVEPRGVPPAPVGVEAWGGFVFVHPTPDARRAADRQRRPGDAHARQLRPRPRSSPA